MKNENWITNSNKVRAWAANQPPSDNITAILLTLTMGDSAATDDLRSTYWTAIRSIGSPLPDFPAAKRGRESGLTEQQEEVKQNVGVTLNAAFASIPTEYHELILMVLTPHGRTGGVFTSMQAWIDNEVSHANTYMADAMKRKEESMVWDGTKVSKTGVPQIVPTVTNEAKKAIAKALLDEAATEGSEEE